MKYFDILIEGLNLQKNYISKSCVEFMIFKCLYLLTYILGSTGAQGPSGSPGNLEKHISGYVNENI